MRKELMLTPTSCLRKALIIPIAGAAWVLVAVPTSAGISAIRLSLAFLFVLRQMVVIAAVLGATHGLLLLLAEGAAGSAAGCERNSADRRWFGAISGGALGLLAFLPIYSYCFILGYPEIILLVIASICGGTAAGLVLCSVLSLRLLNPPAKGRASIVAVLLVLMLAAVEYAVYRNRAVEKLPLLRISVTNIPSGDARGTDWSGCYQYFGIGSNGGEGGRLVVTQRDGALEISVNQELPLRGGIDRDGRFQVGAERNVYQKTVRTLWEGLFSSGLLFTERKTILGDGPVDVTTVKGLGRRISCNYWNPFP